MSGASVDDHHSRTKWRWLNEGLPQTYTWTAAITANQVVRIGDIWTHAASRMLLYTKDHISLQTRIICQSQSRFGRASWLNYRQNESSRQLWIILTPIVNISEVFPRTVLSLHLFLTDINALPANSPVNQRYTSMILRSAECYQKVNISSNISSCLPHI